MYGAKPPAAVGDAPTVKFVPLQMEVSLPAFAFNVLQTPCEKEDAE